jgi:hypothetical protein
MAGMSRYLLLTGASALHASCSTAPAGQERSSRAAQELADTLAGRVAGPSQRCIDSYRATKVHPIDDSTVIYDQGRIIYVQNPKGGCPGIGSGSDILETRQFGAPRLCENEIAHTVDLTSRIERAACVLGPFVPYTKPKS